MPSPASPASVFTDLTSAQNVMQSNSRRGRIDRTGWKVWWRQSSDWKKRGLTASYRDPVCTSIMVLHLHADWTIASCLSGRQWFKNVLFRCKKIPRLQSFNPPLSARKKLHFVCPLSRLDRNGACKVRGCKLSIEFCPWVIGRS